MADLEKDIAQLETLIRRLEREYEQFFAGQLRREPSDTENAVLGIVRGWGTRVIQNSTLAFKFNSLVARYNAFRTIWGRRLREREEGRGALGTRPALPGSIRRPEAPGQLPAGRGLEYVAVNPAHESQRLQKLYAAYRSLREEVGESVEKLRPESFEKAIVDRVEKIKAAQGCDAVLIRVVKEEGKTRIVAKPFRRAKAGKDGGA